MISALSTWAQGASSGSSLANCPNTSGSGESGGSSGGSGGSGGGAGNPTPPTANPNINPYVTAGVALPASLPNGGSTYAIMRFDLGTISPNDPNLAGVVFELQVQQLGLNGYVFKVPRLATKNYPIYLKNLQILVNGTYDQDGNTMSDVETTVSPVAGYVIPPTSQELTPFPALSGRTVLLAQGNGPASDRISLAFAQIRKSDFPATCKALSTFQAKVFPFLTGTLTAFPAVKRCQRCHDSTAAYPSNAAIAAFDMTHAQDNVAVLCAKALQRVDHNNPYQSVLITDPLNQTNGHPSTYDYDAPGITTPDVDPNWIDWMNEEINAP